MTLTEFLAARLGDDEHYVRTMIEVGERKAAAATPGDLADVLSVAIGVLSDPQIPAILARWSGDQGRPPNDLHRLLREVEAKRKILETIDHAERESDAVDNIQIDGYLADDLRKLLALPFSDHPDYDQEWRP